MNIIFLDPSQAADTVPSGMAPRLKSLAGARIGLLSNGKSNSVRLLAMIGKELQSQYGAGELISATKGNASSNCPPSLVTELSAQVDAVITANGD